MTVNFYSAVICVLLKMSSKERRVHTRLAFGASVDAACQYRVTHKIFHTKEAPEAKGETFFDSRTRHGK